jgi:D-serine deaminase-like pyridoxal phosphate-dependent protein
MQTEISKMSVETFQSVETPALILDIDRLRNNASAMRKRCADLGVQLRPHLKTSKSLDVAEVATVGTFGPITVSTTKEAEYFARGGYRDIMYAVAIAEPKLAHIDRIQRETGARILIVVDSIDAATMVVRFHSGRRSIAWLKLTAASIEAACRRKPIRSCQSPEFFRTRPAWRLEV